MVANPKKSLTNKSLIDLLGIGILVTVFYALDRLIERLCTLPESAYYGATIIGGLIRQLARPDVAGAGLLLLVLALLTDAFAKRSFMTRWTDYKYGNRLRLLAVVIAILLAWSFATYGFNLYFDQGHVLDRVVVVLLVLLLYWRPVGLFPFVFVVLAVVNQFGHPVGQWGWTEPSLLIRILILIAAFVTVRAAKEYIPVGARWTRTRLSTDNLVFTIMCLIAAFYFAAGLGKLRLNWLALDQVAYLFPATYSAGWLAFLDAGSMAKIAGWMAAINTPIKLATIALEAGAVFFLMSRRVARGFLFGWVFFHIGIFLSSGIFFWRWIIMDAFLLFAFFGGSAPRFELFQPHLRITAILLVLFGGLWARPTTLAWLDAPVNYAYRATAIASDGKRYRLPPRFFEPYDYQFTLANFGSTVPDTLLGVTFGSAQSRELLEALEIANTPEEVIAIERRFGAARYSANRAARMETFLRRYGSAWNRRRLAGTTFRQRHRWKTLLAAPTHVWSFPRAADIPRGVTIDSIRVNQVFSYYDGSAYREIRDRPVLSVAIE